MITDYPKFSKWWMKYGNFLPLFTSSHAVITLFVSGLGPQLNTPILLTCDNIISIILSIITIAVIIESGGMENSKKWNQDTYVAVLLLNKFQKWRHVRSTEMVYRFQPGKHAHFAQSLKVVFTNVLFLEQHENHKNSILANVTCCVIAVQVLYIRTNMVVRKSNLWNNWVIKICISRTLVTSFFSTSRSTSMNHSKCLCEGHIHKK